MLPSHLRSGTAVSKYRISSSSASRASDAAVARASTGHSQSRSFWGGRRRRWDWASQLDPMYTQFARIRTLKTRAKLLKNIRRRGAFEWDHGTKPFFTPRHLRWASHWRGRQWYTNDDPKQQMKEEEAAAEEEKRAEEDGYELSKREKEWKEQMEFMRKRIEQDPYEAIFGKRFEPFWSPLVPSWMREEMGLQGWPKEKLKEELEKTITAATKNSNEKAKAIVDELQQKLRQDVVSGASSEEVSKKVAAAAEAVKKTSEKADTTLAGMQRRLSQGMNSEGKLRQALKQSMSPADATAQSSGAATASAKPFSRMTRQEKIRHALSTATKYRGPEPISAQPASSQKGYAYASSTSWDSTSNKTRKVEWDSVSNQTKKFEYDPISNRMVEVEVPDKAAIDSDSSAVRQSIGNAQSTSSKTTSEPNKAVEIPFKQSNDVRKSIPIPPPLSQPSHSITLGYTRTSVGPLRSTAVASASIKPAALAKLPAQDLDLLTADNVRASMGKIKEAQAGAKQSTAEEKAELERDFDSNANSQDAEVEAILKERAATKGQIHALSAWDRAEMTDMFEREVDSLHKKKEKLMKDERGLFHIERQKRELQKLDDRIKAVTKRVDAMNLAVVETARPSALQTSLQRAEAKKDSPLLQSSLERMQSRDLPKAPEQDLDDAAAHESTEPIDAPTSVPKEWTKAADLLQADRVKRTAAKRPYPMTRWVDDMNARKVAYQHQKAEAQAAENAKNAESDAKLEKLNKMLQAEIAGQKSNMQAFEGRYAQKVKSLRGELDTAFKQSSVHSEKHVERIRELEAQLNGLKEKEAKYADKVKSLRDELERAYKQSAVHAEKHLERIRYLEGELENASKKPVEAEKSKPHIYPAEGDLCLNLPKYVENGKWYKRPAYASEPIEAEIEKAEQKAYDQALVEEVQSIYENEYGVIDENHEQPQPVEAEPAVNDLTSLAKALSNAVKGEQPQAVEAEPATGSMTSLANALSNAVQGEDSLTPSKKLTKSEKRAERRARKVEQAEEKARQVVEVESDVDLGEELAKYEKDNPQAYKVEETLAAPESAEKMKSVIADALEQEVTTNKPDATAPAAMGVQWTEPPLYKVLAYDSGNDMMSSATTTTSVLPGSAEERPLGIPEALSQLYQPARFVPYFAELQSDNFQAIAATREVIVFRQVKKAVQPETKPARYRGQRAGLEDHGLNSLRANLDQDMRTSKGSRSDINPIDGTSKRHLKPTTGNFASPTGFVNHDPVFPPEETKEEESPAYDNELAPQAQSDTYSTIAKEPAGKTSRQIWESLPGSNETPVKRTEPVFSGEPVFSSMTKKERSRYGKEQQRIFHESTPGQRKQRKAEMKALRAQAKQHQQSQQSQKQYQQEQQNDEEEFAEDPVKKGGNALKYMLGVGLSTATVMYLVGALAERERAPGAPRGQGNQGFLDERVMWERERLRKLELEAERKRLEDETARLTREWERR